MSELKDRMVIITIETLMQMLKDYVGEGDLPRDAKAVKFMVNPQEFGKLAILAESDEWKREDAAPLMVKFDMRRVYSV